MIYITGDKQGQEQHIIEMIQASPVQQGNLLIILGDFGLPWVEADIKTSTFLEELKAFLKEEGITLAFLEGNRVDFDWLESHPIEEHWGALVQNVDGIYHLLRGQIYTIDGYQIFTFGGASSFDNSYRLEHQSWWPQECPTFEVKKAAMEQLRQSSYEVDYVLTFQGPRHFYYLFEDLIPKSDLALCPTQDFLDDVAYQCRYKKWYFSNFRGDRKDKKAQLVWKDIVPLIHEP